MLKTNVNPVYINISIILKFEKIIGFDFRINIFSILLNVDCYSQANFKLIENIK